MYINTADTAAYKRSRNNSNTVVDNSHCDVERLLFDCA